MHIPKLPKMTNFKSYSVSNNFKEDHFEKDGFIKYIIDAGMSNVQINNLIITDVCEQLSKSFWGFKHGSTYPQAGP